MGDEKLPKDYSPGVIQKILERLKMSVTTSDQKRAQQLYDTSQEMKQQLADLEKKLTEKISTKDGERTPTHAVLPIPQDLGILELGTWGWATINPFQGFKYIGKITGYEFYGSQNTGISLDPQDPKPDYLLFKPKADPYLQIGYHRGDGPKDEYLNTRHSTDDSLSFIFDPRLVQLTLDTQKYPDIDEVGTNYHKEGDLYYNLVLENTTQGTKGPIALGAYNLLNAKYQIKATGVTWNADDRWVIKNYPQNRLFNIGPFCTFTKRAGNFYVIARSTGRGNAASEFTQEEVSTGLTSTEKELSIPTLVYPIHSDGTTCDLVDGRPVHETLGIVPWTSIVAGTRETDHLNFFGLEWCNVEIVYNTIDEDDLTGGIFYQVVRTGEAIEGVIDSETGLM